MVQKVAQGTAPLLKSPTPIDPLAILASSDELDDNAVRNPAEHSLTDRAETYPSQASSAECDCASSRC